MEISETKSSDDQATEANIQEEKPSNYQQNDRYHCNISLNPSINIMSDTTSSNLQEDSINNSMKSKKQVGKVVTDCPPPSNDLNPSDNHHSVETMLHGSLPERRGFSLPVITKPQSNYEDKYIRTIIEAKKSAPQEHNTTKRNGKQKLPAVTMLVDQSGATIKLEGYGVSLTIPPGALQKAVAITLTVVQDSDALPEVEDHECNAAPTVRCLPTGLQFRKPVMIRIPHCAIVGKDDKMTTTIHSNHEAEGWSY